jgi:uncharacterized protein (AIM24 family)
MAQFDIQSSEGMHWVKVTLKDDAVRTEKGALNHFVGDIKMDTPLPTLRNAGVALFSEESLFRPCYEGTGELYLDSSLGGFHILEMRAGDSWIVDNGVYWASDDEIDLSVQREPVLTAFWAGEGLFWYQTRLRAKAAAQAALATTGPVEEVVLNGQRLVVDGRMVIARTEGIQYSICKPTRSWIGYFLSGQQAAHVYEGTGRLLFSTTPYWRRAIASRYGLLGPAAPHLME